MAYSRAVPFQKCSTKLCEVRASQVLYNRFNTEVSQHCGKHIGPAVRRLDGREKQTWRLLT